MHHYSMVLQGALSVKDEWVRESQLCELVPSEGKLVVRKGKFLSLRRNRGVLLIRGILTSKIY